MTTSELAAYFGRVRHAGPVRADCATLTALHRAHVNAIPFENLDIQMGAPIRLDAGSLQAKMIQQRRGGYCFEQNSLFMLALGSVGFRPEAREARVRQHAAGAIRPRTHMVLTIPCDGREWLADVGFGGDGLIEPIAMDGTATTQAGVDYRVANEGSLRVLQRRTPAGWEDLYAIQPGPVYAIDFEVANWFTSTHPRSPFVLNLTAQRVTSGARHILRNLTYAIARGPDLQISDITRRELMPLLRDTFDLDVPENARFRALDPGCS